VTGPEPLGDRRAITRSRKELLADEQASTLKVSAIPCASAEHAEAARQVFGESDQRH